MCTCTSAPKDEGNEANQNIEEMINSLADRSPGADC